MAILKSGFKQATVFSLVLLSSLSASASWFSRTPQTPKEAFQDLVAAGEALKCPVRCCYKKTHSFADCDGGKNGIPENVLNNTTGSINVIRVKSGVIYIGPNNYAGLVKSDSYILTPSATTKDEKITFTFTASGGGVAKGYTK